MRQTSAMLTISSGSDFVLDDIRVQTIDYVADAGARTELESHLQTHAVFLPHWASIHTAWHFYDPQSPIINYKWALGTSRGGTQLQPYQDVGRRTEATSTLISPSPHAPLHISVQATNAAGLVTVAHSPSITVDVTPPVFQHIRDGQVSDVDYQSGGVISVSWEVQDQESGIKHCGWAIGRTKGGSDVKRYARVVSEENRAEYDVKDELNNADSLTLYSTVRCHNNVGLASSATTDGVRVFNSPLVTSLQELTLIPSNSSVYTSGGVCHNSRNTLRLRWEISKTHIKSLWIGIEGRHVDFRRNIDDKLCYSTVTLTGLQLELNSLYEVYLITSDVLGIQSNRTDISVTTPVKAPIISEGVEMTVGVAAGEVTLDWSQLFVSTQQLHFLVTLGTVRGGADVASLTTRENHVTLVLPPHHVLPTSVHMSIVAFDACGQTAFYSKIISLP